MAIPLIQEDPGLQRRKELALAMMQAGQKSSPVQHWTQGANRIAQGLLGAYNLRQAQQEDAKRQQLGGEVVRQAIGEMQAPSDPMMSGPQGTQFDVGGPSSEQPMQRFAEVLAESPYTQEFGTNMMLQNMLAQQQLQRQAQQKGVTRRADLESKKELEEFKKKLGQKYPKPESEFDQYLKTLQAEKAKADIATKKQKLEEKELAKKAEEDTLDNTLNLAKQFLSHPGFDRIYGTFAGSALSPNLTQEAVNADAMRETLISKMVLAQRGALKGQGSVSDTESKMIENAASMLRNTRIDPETAKEEALRVIEYLQRKKNEKSGDKTETSKDDTLPTPQTTEQFNALQPGELYIDPDDGLTYRKK